MVTTRASQIAPEPAQAAVSAQVADILESIKNTSTSAAATAVETATVPKLAAKTGSKKPKKAATVPRGIAKSGRPWKEVKQKYVFTLPMRKTQRNTRSQY